MSVALTSRPWTVEVIRRDHIFVVVLFSILAADAIAGGFWAWTLVRAIESSSPSLTMVLAWPVFIAVGLAILGVVLVWVTVPAPAEVRAGAPVSPRIRLSVTIGLGLCAIGVLFRSGPAFFRVLEAITLVSLQLVAFCAFHWLTALQAVRAAKRQLAS